MYHGKMTSELKKLYLEYTSKFGVSPDYYEAVEYSDANYSDYVSDIKKSLKTGVHLPNLYPENEDDF